MRDYQIIDAIYDYELRIETIVKFDLLNNRFLKIYRVLSSSAGLEKGKSQTDKMNKIRCDCV